MVVSRAKDGESARMDSQQKDPSPPRVTRIQKPPVDVEPAATSLDKLLLTAMELSGIKQTSKEAEQRDESGVTGDKHEGSLSAEDAKEEGTIDEKGENKEVREEKKDEENQIVLDTKRQVQSDETVKVDTLQKTEGEQKEQQKAGTSVPDDDGKVEAVQVAPAVQTDSKVNQEASCTQKRSSPNEEDVKPKKMKQDLSEAQQKTPEKPKWRLIPTTTPKAARPDARETFLEGAPNAVKRALPERKNEMFVSTDRTTFEMWPGYLLAVVKKRWEYLPDGRVIATETTLVKETRKKEGRCQGVQYRDDGDAGKEAVSKDEPKPGCSKPSQEQEKKME